MKHIMNPWDNGVIIRPWDEEDSAAMADIHRRAILATTDELLTQTQRESWAHGLDGNGYVESAKKGEIFTVAVDENDKPLAFCGYRNNELYGLFVDPDHQGKNIASRLMSRAIANLLQSRPEKLVLESSLAAAMFYETRGFNIIGERTVDTRGGGTMPVLDMETDPIEYSTDIGPHTGRELELMLKGEKRLAWFQDMDPIEAFAPHVEAGIICRFEWHDWTKNFYLTQKDHLPTNVIWPEPAFYFLPGEENRVEEFMEIRADYEVDGPGWHLQRERRIGELLDYPEQAIQAFIAQVQLQAKNGDAIILDN
ncbi:N-acetyltransferase family protein [Maritalea sp.]|uniref:GNAT family N-acetyltransferase n=1 Tax=Maritalea sp. TaxID=2003361 RepID=UPI003EF14507